MPLDIVRSPASLEEPLSFRPLEDEARRGGRSTKRERARSRQASDVRFKESCGTINIKEREGGRRRGKEGNERRTSNGFYRVKITIKHGKASKWRFLGAFRQQLNQIFSEIRI